MIALLLVAVLALIYYGRSLIDKTLRFRYRKQLTARIPGYEGFFPLGNLIELGNDAEAIPRTLLILAKRAREEYGVNILKLWILHESAFLPLNGEMVQCIIDSTEEINKGENYSVFAPWLGSGLLLSTGDKWKSRRKLLTPSFHFSMLVGYIETMHQQTKVLLEVLDGQKGVAFDIYPYMKRCALDIICETAMGKHLNSQLNPDQPYVQAIHNITVLAMDMPMKPHLWNPLGRWLSGWNAKMDVNVEVAHSFTRKERCVSTSRETADETKRRTFLDVLLDEMQQSDLTSEDIREEVDTFMFAGHDTTSSAMSWTIWCMANHLEIQDRVYNEINEVMGDDGECTKEKLGRLIYLDRCIKEAMRLFPPIPFVIRHLHNELKMGDYTLPKESSITIAPYLIHRNERIYPNPLRYDPDRFLPENIAGRHPYAFIPFSAGVRNCLGQKFAMYEVKIVISAILRKYRVLTTKRFEDITILTEVVLKAQGGINVIIERR